MWREGDVVVLRNVYRGRLFSATPLRVVEHAPERIVLWLAGGTRRRAPAVRSLPAEWTLADREWVEPGLLVAYRPGDAYSLWHLRRSDGSFAAWYANLERPWRETALGWDTADHVLDVRREPGGEWKLKDADELAEAVRLGVFTDDDARRIRADAARVMRETAVPTGWEDWQPPPEWTVPTLPEGADVVAG